MTPPIGVVYVYRQERASSAAELRHLLKGMLSHASSIFFTSVTDVQSVLICELGSVPKNRVLKYSLGEAVHYWREDSNDKLVAPLWGSD